MDNTFNLQNELHKGILEEYDFKRVTLTFLTMSLILIQNKLRSPLYYSDVESETVKLLTQATPFSISDQSRLLPG